LFCEFSTFCPPKKIPYHAIFSSGNGALNSLPFSLFLQPFWQVLSYQNSRGRGVVGKICKNPLFINFFYSVWRLIMLKIGVLRLMINNVILGVLEANFIEPTHNKQDFERTSLFQKLEARLKEMTCEYW
jgi:hypothetical protein